MTLAISGSLLFVTPQTFTTNGAGENTDVALASLLLHVTPSVTNDFISGFIPSVLADGILCWVWNIDTTKNLLLKQTTNSTSGYRIVMPVGLTTLTLLPMENAWIMFRQGVGWSIERNGAFT